MADLTTSRANEIPGGGRRAARIPDPPRTSGVRRSDGEACDLYAVVDQLNEEARR
jgi:hypothetical protein